MKKSQKLIFLIVGTAVFGFSAQAAINLDFTTLSGVGNGTFTVGNVGGTPTLTDSNSNVSNLTGSLSGVTGSFTFTVAAYGTVADPFDSTDFTGGAATLAAPNGLTVSSDNRNGSVRSGQGLVFSFDLSGLTGATKIALTDATYGRNDNEWRIAFRNEGTGTPSIVYSGTGSLTSTTIDSSSDLIGVYNTNSRNNNQFRSMTIDVVPEPSSYALLAGLAALGTIMLRRRGRTN